MSVSGVGGRHIFPADRDVDDHVYTMYEFPGRGYYKDDNPKQDIDDPEQEDRGQLFVDQWQRLWRLRRGGPRHRGYADPGTREKDVMLYKKSETMTKISVKDGAGGPAMDTYETGEAAWLPWLLRPFRQEVSRGYREEIEHWAWCIKNPASGK